MKKGAERRGLGREGKETGREGGRKDGMRGGGKEGKEGEMLRRGIRPQEPALPLPFLDGRHLSQ